MDKSNNVAVVKVVMVDEGAEEVGLNAVVGVAPVRAGALTPGRGPS